MLEKALLEPLVTGEQGVVYLFSRYWKQIPIFQKNIFSIEKIQTRFPDALYYDKNENLGGIEFEHDLSKFLEHLSKKIKYPDFKKKVIPVNGFYDIFKPKATLFVVYWNEDKTEKEIENEFKKKERRYKIVFLNLSKLFKHVISKKNSPSLTFHTNHVNKSSYLKFTAIKREFTTLKERKLVEIAKSSNNPIRIMGYNPKAAEDISLAHWNLMKFYTTKGKIWNSKESYQLIVLRDKNDNLLVIKPEFLFKYTEKSDKVIQKFFDKYYFIGKLAYWDDFTIPYCVIYDESKYTSSNKVNRELIQKLIELKAKKGKRKRFNLNGYVLNAEEDRKLFSKFLRL